MISNEIQRIKLVIKKFEKKPSEEIKKTLLKFLDIKQEYRSDMIWNMNHY